MSIIKIIIFSQMLLLLNSCKKEDFFHNDLLVGKWVLIEVKTINKQELVFEQYEIHFLESGHEQLILKDTSISFRYENIKNIGGSKTYKLNFSMIQKPFSRPQDLNPTHIGFASVYDVEINKNTLNLFSFEKLLISNFSSERDFIQYTFVKK